MRRLWTGIAAPACVRICRRFDDASRKKFEGEVFAQVREEYPTQSDGSIIFPFPRFFFLATR